MGFSKQNKKTKKKKHCGGVSSSSVLVVCLYAGAGLYTGPVFENCRDRRPNRTDTEPVKEMDEKLFLDPNFAS